MKTAGLTANPLITSVESEMGSALAGKRSATFLVAHGAWSAGWAWKKMHPILSAAGHRLITPTYTGLGERAHLASPANDLETHILDILGVIEYEDLRDIILIGHSYGGMVASGVADRVGGRISKMIYLDAFVPKDGEAVADLLPNGYELFQARAKEGDGWRVSPNPTPPDTSEADLKWIADRRMPQSLKCFVTPLKLHGGERLPPRTYIYCKRLPPGDPFGQFAQRAKNEHWVFHEMDASHSPQITAPEALAAVLQSVVLSHA